MNLFNYVGGIEYSKTYKYICNEVALHLRATTFRDVTLVISGM